MPRGLPQQESRADMPDNRVDYDPIAPGYHQRYAANPLAGVAAALRGLASGRASPHILEAGCGTGRWLSELFPLAGQICGLDLSAGMLQQARQRGPHVQLVCGSAARLPFPTASFDLIYCVNALHHFDQPERFIAEARRLLRPGGALALIGMDPHTGRDRWYLYDYFHGTRQADLARFPPAAKLAAWLSAAGFSRIASREVERITATLTGREVLADHFLTKDGTSQLSLLSQNAYEAGLGRIEADVEAAEAAGQKAEFVVDIGLTLVEGGV